MAKQIEGVYENVLRCARQEFLEKGFALASLRDIAKAAGTSTGSIYTRFTDKAGLFRALVEPAAGELKRRFLEIQESFHRFDGQTQQEEMGRYTAHAQEGLFDYIYEHLPEFELLLRRAAGTEYAHYIDELVEIEVSYTYKYMEVIGCESVRSGQVTEDLIHIVTTAYFNGMFERCGTAWIRPGRSTMSASSTAIIWQDLRQYFILKTSGSAKGRFPGGLFIEPKVSNN